MDTQEIRNTLEESNLDSFEIDNIIKSISQQKNPTVKKSLPVKSKEETIENLRSELLRTEDWKKRAKIAARIISLSI